MAFDIFGRDNAGDDFFGRRTAGAETAGSAPTSGAPAAGSEADLVGRSAAIEKEENRRYGEGIGIAKDVFGQSQAALSELLDEDLLFSRAADSVGARAKGQVESLRRSLGGRGLRPGSGASRTLQQRIGNDITNANTGARRDIALENQNVRHKNATIQFAQALGLNQAINAPVSQIGLDTATNIFEGDLTREGIASMERSNRQASKDDKKAATVGSATNLIPLL